MDSAARRLLIRLVTLTAACAPGPPAAVTGPAAEAEQAYVVFGADTLVAEVANTETERARGLMGRSTLPEGSGMLFVFGEPEIQGVWMRDTPLPLDAAFIDEDRRVTTIVGLEPFDETVRYSDVPIEYVLEVERGWFAEHGVEAGDTATIRFLPPP